MASRRDPDGNRVDAYFDLHLKVLSLRPLSGPMADRVAEKPGAMVFDEVSFRVQRGGIARIRERGQRAVVAFARGVPRRELDPAVEAAAAGAERVSFNPFKWDSFVAFGDAVRPITRADRLIIIGTDAFAVGAR